MTTPFRRGLLPMAAAIAFIGVLGVEPASAASRSGGISCNNTFSPRLRIDSSATGNGSWQSTTTGQTRALSFPAGASFNFSPYQKVNYAINNGSGFFYGISETCIQ